MFRVPLSVLERKLYYSRCKPPKWLVASVQPASSAKVRPALHAAAE